MNPFETETMADLCLRQGHLAEGLAIYRRLLIRSADEATRERIARRIAAAEPRGPKSVDPPVQATAATSHREETAPLSRREATTPFGAQPPLSLPGVRARWSERELTVEWRLPAETKQPSLEVLLITRGPKGIETETRAINVDAPAGRITLPVKDLHQARVAAGFRAGDRFVPIARA